MRCETVLSKKEQTNMKLTNMSKVQTGLVLVRKRADAKDKGAHKYRMLTLKSFNPKGWLMRINWMCFSQKKNSKISILQIMEMSLFG